MYKIVMAMSRDIVRYIICSTGSFGVVVTVIKIDKLISFSYIEVSIRVYGTVFINNYTMNKLTIRLF